ncbi:MAG TPA: flagellar basal body rod protein FlgC [Candidatus Acidoferrales bacterium]|nr:flagellar basal body rod protein FlgC [Candidatus Acidoferrales bacterium]
MGFYNAIEISASGMSAERLAMDVIANNIANANTTHTPQGGAFKRQLIVFAQKSAAPDEANGTADENGGFDAGAAPKPSVDGVQALGIVDDQSPDRLVFDPGNPDADARGYVHYPNVQVVTEMVDMMAASRAYEANVAVVQETKSMESASVGLLSS